MLGLSSLRAACSSEGPPVFLLVYGALITAGLLAIGSARIAVCGRLFFDAWCANTFASTLPQAVWLGYFFVGIGATLVAMTFGWPRMVGALPKLDRRLGWTFAAVPLGLAAMLTVALGEWYIPLFAAIHGVLLFALERRQGRTLGAFDGALLFVSWVTAATLAYRVPLDVWLRGSLVPGNAAFALAVFCGALLLNCTVLRITRDEAKKSPIGAAVLTGIALAIFALLSFRQDSLYDMSSIHHWSFYVGPIELVRQGGWLLWDVPSQYGFLNILIAARLPFASAWTSFYVLDAMCVFASAALVFFTLRSLRLGRFTGIFAFVVTLTVVFLIPGDYAHLGGPTYYPSVAAFRFLWVEVLLAVVLSAYAKRRDDRRAVIVAGSLVWILGTLWSAEGAIYVSILWFPTLVALVFRRTSGGTTLARIRALSQPRHLVLLALPAMFFIAALLVAQVTYTIALGHSPDYFAFYEYGLSYAGGFAVYPIGPFGSVWFLLLAFAICVSASVVVLRVATDPWRVLPLLYASCALVWVTSSYFITRSADSNVTNIVTPVFLAIAAVLFVLDRERPRDLGSRAIRFALVAPLTVMMAITFGNGPGLSALAGVIRGGYTGNIPGALPTLSQSALALLAEGHVSPSDPMVYEGNELMPQWPGTQANTIPSARWYPANPSVLLTPIPLARRIVYVDRFTQRRPLDGWYFRPHGAATCESSTDQRYISTKNYSNAEWDLSWCVSSRR